MEFLNYLRNQTYQKRISCAMRVARKQRSLTLAESALYLGFPQKQVESFETCKSLPNFLEWAQISDRFGIDSDLCRGGLVDAGSFIEINPADRPAGFSLPARYTSWRATSNRWVLPLIEYLKFKLGDHKFMKFCEKIEVDPDYFYLADQLVNFPLTHDILLEIVRLDREDGQPLKSIHTIIRAAFDDFQSSRLRAVYKKYSSSEDVLSNLNDYNRYMDLAFSYERVEHLEDGHYICATAADWLRTSIDLDSNVKVWYHQYKIDWIRNLLRYSSGVESIVEIIELDDKRDPDCLFRLQIA